jgi:hypothetical protein
MTRTNSELTCKLAAARDNARFAGRRIFARRLRDAMVPIGA